MARIFVYCFISNVRGLIYKKGLDYHALQSRGAPYIHILYKRDQAHPPSYREEDKENVLKREERQI